MPLGHEILLFATAVLAGMVNSVAGGGTLLTFPALMMVLAGAPTEAVRLQAAVLANGTSTVALVPGSAVAAWEYRREFGKAGRWLLWLLVPSVIGSMIGVLLVTQLPPHVFEWLVPWLILFAAILFAVQPRIARWMTVRAPHERPPAKRLAGILLFQTLVAVYGGYFGAGIGILMLSALALMGLTDIHIMNGVKNVLATSINAVAAAVFIITGKVEWSLCLPMLVSAIVGGYVGSRIAQRASRTIVRRVVVAIGFSLAAYYFFQQLRG